MDHEEAMNYTMNQPKVWHVKRKLCEGYGHMTYLVTCIGPRELSLTMEKDARNVHLHRNERIPVLIAQSRSGIPPQGNEKLEKHFFVIWIPYSIGELYSFLSLIHI